VSFPAFGYQLNAGKLELKICSKAALIVESTRDLQFYYPGFLIQVKTAYLKNIILNFFRVIFNFSRLTIIVLWITLIALLAG